MSAAGSTIPRGMNRVSRVAAGAALAGLALAAAGLTQGPIRLALFVLAGLMVPSLIQALRGRVGPLEILARWKDRFRHKRECRPGRVVTFAWQVGGPLLSVICARPLGPTYHCLVEGPSGVYEAWFSTGDPAPISPVKFTDDFKDEQGNRPPSITALPSGLYFQSWWSYSAPDSVPEFIAQGAFGLTRRGMRKPYLRERLWNRLVRCTGE